MLSAPVRTRRRITLGLLIAAGCISCIDRAALSVGNTAIMADLHLSYTQMGLLLSVFPWAYLAGQIPMGLLADRFGSRGLLGCGLVLWSVAQMAFGAMFSLSGLMLARIGLGLGETPLFLSGTRALVRWFEPNERGRPLGAFNASAALGPALAPPILLPIMAVWGWRGMSVAIGAASLVLAAIWIGYYRDPTRNASHATGIKAVVTDDLFYLLRQRSTWAAMIGFIGVVYLTGLFGTWMPAWLERSEHLNAYAAGLLSALPQAAGVLGAVTGGWITDRLAHRGASPLQACRRPLVLSMLAAGLATACIPFLSALDAVIALMALALFAGGIATTCGWTLGTVITQEHRVGTMEALQNTGGSLGGAMVPTITGLCLDRWHSFLPAAIATALIAVLCAASYRFGLREKE